MTLEEAGELFLAEMAEEMTIQGSKEQPSPAPLYLILPGDWIIIEEWYDGLDPA